MIMAEDTEKKEKKYDDKPLTPLQVLKSQPKAMQVGPQLHLRKSFYKEREEKEKNEK